MAEIETIEDAIEEACDLLRVEMMKNKNSIKTALNNVAGQNEGDVGTVKIGANASLIETQGTAGLEVLVSGSFVKAKCTFTSDRVHVGGPEDGIGENDLGLAADNQE